jgi:hypothetical protein
MSAKHAHPRILITQRRKHGVGNVRLRVKRIAILRRNRLGEQHLRTRSAVSKRAQPHINPGSAWVMQRKRDHMRR